MWYGIGILYDRYGSLEHAEEAFSQVMRMAPDFDKANEIYFRLGIIYKQQNKYNESLECFRWIAHNPPSPLNQTDILFQIGHVHEQQNDFESAKTAYQRVLDRDPHHAKVLQQLGWLYHQESSEYNTQEKAIEFLEKSVNSDQNDAQSWYLLGRCYMSQQKFPKAYEAYQQAVYRDGRNPTFWCSIGVLYYQINQYRDALDAYSRAIRLNPNISEVWYDLGTLYQSCNNQTNDAMDAYQRAAELDPNNPHIKSRLALLRSGHSGPPPGGPTGLPPDGHPQTYEPAALNGPPQPQWAPSMPQSGHLPRTAAPPQGPPNGREWRPNDVHGPPTQPPPPAHQYDPRDGHRAPPPPSARPHSPRTEQLRHEVRYTPTQRPAQISSSPRMPESTMYRPPPQAPPGPPPPGSGVPPHAQPPRMNNPNYPSQAPQPAPPQQGPPSYPRQPPSPPPNVNLRPMERPRSPRSTYPGPPPQPWGAYPPEPSRPPPMNHGPSEQLRREEVSARDRNNQTPVSNGSSKRGRDLEDRDPDSGVKRPMNEETRARVEDPAYHRFRASPAPHIKQMSDQDRPRLPEYGPTHNSGTNSGAPSQVPSPTVARRIEDQRRVEESYKPSEAAHHPQSMHNIIHNQHEQLPPINTTSNGGPSGPPSLASNTSAARVDDHVQKKEEPEQRSPRDRRDQDGDVRMRGEEPAMRKMDVNEDYDEGSDEEPAKGKAVDGGRNVSNEQLRGSPKSSGPPSVNAETPNSAKPDTK